MKMRILIAVAALSVWSAAYATLASPALTGTPTAPTAAVSTDTTQVATTAYVMAAKEDDQFVLSMSIFS